MRFSLVSRQTSHMVCIEQLIWWRTPSDHFIKLNTDGSTEGNPDWAGAGGLLCDSCGGWKVGFVRYIDITSAIVVELWMMLHDELRIAQQMRFSSYLEGWIGCCCSC